MSAQFFENQHIGHIIGVSSNSSSGLDRTRTKDVMMQIKSIGKYFYTGCQIASIVLWATASLATNRYVATTGSDAANDCSVLITPCLTLQWAVSQSIAGDTINMAAGTYTVAGLVSINKTITILGAQAGVDARTRVGSETILSNSQGMSVSANNVVFDGLTIQDSVNPALTGYGLRLNPGINGTQVINNIFKDNIVGLGISNGGATQCLVQHNLFKDNNQAGGASGTGIYTDQFVSQAVSNVLINENLFENNDNAGIAFSSSDITKPDSNITVTNNVINNCGRGMYFLNTQSSSVTDNTITNLTDPTDTGSSVGIGIYGAVSDLVILRNNIETGTKYGIRFNTFIAGTPPPPNTNITIHQNNIFGFATAGMIVEVAPTGSSDYATCNWWGSDTGPTNPTLNPTGTGDIVTGDLIAANFNPWLLGIAPDGLCGQLFEPPTVAKSFSPSTIYRGDNSTLTITLTNPNDEIATLEAPFVDTFPIHIKVINKPSTTCGGTVAAIKGSSKITLNGGAIPANGSCKIKVKVTSCAKGNFTNTIPVGALQTDKGNNTNQAEATLKVLCSFDYKSALDPTKHEKPNACYPY
jgi:hypothetical protein